MMWQKADLHGHDTQPGEDEAGTAVNAHSPKQDEAKPQEHHHNDSQAKLHNAMSVCDA